MREVLVRAAQERGIELRQSYRRLAKRALAQQGRYAQARQMKRAGKMTQRLKTYLSRVYRDISRKAGETGKELQELLELAGRLLEQERDSKNKLYSIHAPEVECISKGKAHKRYEFGCKVSMVTSSKGNWILGIRAIYGNPYDGHTLEGALKQVKELVGWKLKKAYVDLGYRGHNYEGETGIRVVNCRTVEKYTRWARKWIKRRAAIEPIFGHLKSGNRLDRNHLKGTEGDRMNAILSGCGFNMRKLLRAFFLPFRIFDYIGRKIDYYLSQRDLKTMLPFQFYVKCV